MFSTVFITNIGISKKSWGARKIFSMHYASERTARKKFLAPQDFFTLFIIPRSITQRPSPSQQIFPSLSPQKSRASGKTSGWMRAGDTITTAVKKDCPRFWAVMSSGRFSSTARLGQRHRAASETRYTARDTAILRSKQTG